MKLCICIPTYDRWEADFGYSLAVTAANLVGSRTDLQSLRIVKSEGSIASDGRNDLIKDALDSGATHILWLDTDMSFSPKNVVGLIERDMDFVACDYKKRIAPNDTIALDLEGKPLDWSGHGLKEVLQCGLGLTLMKTSILEKMTYPWSGFFTHENGTLDDSVWLCRNARKAGAKLFVDMDATRGVGHIGKQVHEVA
jgi:hypothetical protein